MCISLMRWQFPPVRAFQSARVVSFDSWKCLVIISLDVGSWPFPHASVCFVSQRADDRRWSVFFFYPFSLSSSGKMHVDPLCLWVFHFGPWSFDFFFFLICSIEVFGFPILPFKWNWSYMLIFILALILLIFGLFFVPLIFSICKF